MDESMTDARELAAVAALIGDPARARMLESLMSGVALTATELALEANIAPSTASSHLAKLTARQILRVVQQGRHRYYRLDGDEIAEALESLMGVAAARTPRRRIGPADPAMRVARVCYDHLAGERGVWLLESLRARKVIEGRDASILTRDGETFLEGFGIDLEPLKKSRRPLCRPCLDWSERRHHLGGGLGAAILDRIFALRWARRETAGRAVLFSAAGEHALRARLEG
jgi:DNA-binding transcriptional ArsR family regulator